MNRTRRIGRAGGLATAAVAATPFAYLWVFQVTNAKEPPTAEVRLDIALWMAVFAMPSMLAAWLLWRAWWRQAGDRLAALDGPGRLLQAATATLPADRRDWGAAMAAELTQVPAQGRAARWRFAAGCARTALFPPGGNRAAVAVAGGLALAGVAVTLGYTAWYLAEHPTTPSGLPPTISATLGPGTASSWRRCWPAAWGRRCAHHAGCGPTGPPGARRRRRQSRARRRRARRHGAGLAGSAA
jgi:hypothetical protein